MKNQFRNSHVSLMKNLFFIFIFISSTYRLEAMKFMLLNEETEQKDDSIPLVYANQVNDLNYMSSKNMPQFPGGFDKLMAYLEQNISYPEEAKKNNEQGQVIVQFWIEETGKIKDVSILKGISQTLDTEAIRLIYNMPNWIPAEKSGKKVKVMHIISVNFRLDNILIPVSENEAQNNSNSTD